MFIYIILMKNINFSLKKIKITYIFLFFYFFIPILLKGELIETKYKIGIFYGIFDSPYENIIKRYFSSYFFQILKDNISNSFNFDIKYNKKLIEFIFKETNIEKLKKVKNFIKFKKIFKQKYEWCIFISISDAYKKIKIRYIHLKLKKIFPIIYKDYKNNFLIHKILIKTLFKTFLIEGYISKIKDKNEEIYIKFRGDKQEILKLNILKENTPLEIYYNNKILKNSIILAKKIIKNDKDFLEIKGIYKGITALNDLKINQYNIKCIPIYCLGGLKKFIILDELKNPVPGFSIYKSYEDFKISPDNYYYTTDISGTFYIKDNRKAPIFLVITKGINDVTYPFVEKIVTINSYEKEKYNEIYIFSKEIELKKRKEGESYYRDQDWIKKLIKLRFIQTNNFLKNKKLKKALTSIKLIEIDLSYLNPKDNEFKILKNILNKIKNKYNEKILIKNKATEEYIICQRLIEDADKLVNDKYEYKKALVILKKSKSYWPKNYYKEDYKKLLERIEKVKFLIKKDKQSLGKVRKYFIKLINKKDMDIDILEINEIEKNLNIFLEEAIINPEEIYNDIKLYIKIKIFLNKLSEKYIEKSQIYLKKFKISNSAREREKNYAKYIEYYQISKEIDKWLKRMNREF